MSLSIEQVLEHLIQRAHIDDWEYQEWVENTNLCSISTLGNNILITDMEDGDTFVFEFSHVITNKEQNNA